MNAVIETTAPGSAAPIPPAPIGRMRTLKWLLLREFWENKGGFLWAPLIAAAVSLLFAIIGGGAGQWALSRIGERMVTVNGQQVAFDNVDFATLLQQMSASDLQQWQYVMTSLTLLSSFWPWLVSSFVVFFYLIGSLYDQRRDRSILFWKSMPVSDTMTVLSKCVSAVIVVPVLTLLISGVLMLASAVVISILMLVNDVDPIKFYWGQLDYSLIAATLGAWLPMHLLWSLPTVGWLLLCSAWARSKPFLWATVLPILAGALVSWFGLLRAVDVPSGWFWTNIVARLLTSAWPGMHMMADPRYGDVFNDVTDPGWHDGVLSVITGQNLLVQPQLWIGAVVGIAMIFATIRVLRWRDEA